MTSCIIAFAMYSKIPMPKVEWNEKNMKYAICYFPCVGAVLAILEWITFSLCEWLQFGSLLRGSLLFAVSLLITGGIHMDGYLDTVDARSSYGDREKKLAILSDPHTGAFALIKGILYTVLQVGFLSEITKQGFAFYIFVFVISRALSGLALATFRGAKKEGLLATFAKGANRKVVIATMLLYLLGVIGIVGRYSYLLKNGVYLITMVIASIAVFFYYRYFSYREFGGITGDLAGYFLQLLELVTLMAIVIAGAIF